MESVDPAEKIEFMKSTIIFALFLLLTVGAIAQKPVSEQLADTAMNRIWVDDRNQPGIPAWMDL